MTGSAEQLAYVHAGNLRVPLANFAAVWAAADRRNREQGAVGVSDWYAAGVLATCEWLAGAIHRTPWGQQRPALAPATRTRATAYEELIEAEFQAAELLAERQPELAEGQPGWCEGIRVTLRWAWRHEGPPPLEVPDDAAGC